MPSKLYFFWTSRTDWMNAVRFSLLPTLLENVRPPVQPPIESNALTSWKRNTSAQRAAFHGCITYVGMRLVDKLREKRVVVFCQDDCVGVRRVGHTTRDDCEKYPDKEVAVTHPKA